MKFLINDFGCKSIERETAHLVHQKQCKLKIQAKTQSERFNLDFHKC